jgi:hypothetical protein
MIASLRAWHRSSEESIDSLSRPVQRQRFFDLGGQHVTWTRALPELLGTAGCANNLCGCDGLAYMTLRVIGNVDQQTADRRGQLFAADSARVFKVHCCQFSDALHTAFESRTQSRENLLSSGHRIEFRFHGRSLFGRQQGSFRVSEQPIHAAANMLQLEGNRSDSRNTRVQFDVTQIAALLVDVFARQFQRVNHRAMNGRQVSQRAA